jgi:hypothetical protein
MVGHALRNAMSLHHDHTARAVRVHNGLHTLHLLRHALHLTLLLHLLRHALLAWLNHYELHASGMLHALLVRHGLHTVSWYHLTIGHHHPRHLL